MKPIFAALLAFFSISAWSQNTPKLYGYKQTVSAGVRPNQTISEDGTSVTDQPKRLVNYFAYFTTPSKSRLYPMVLFIEGIRYDVQAVQVKQTPVLQENQSAPGQKPEVLVPKTTQVVYKLVPSSATAASAKAGNSLKTTVQNNALVFVYRQGGKTYTRSLKSLSQLTPQAML